MALGTNNIGTIGVGTEIGLHSHRIAVLSAAPGLNKFSYYAPGALSVDSNKDIVLTHPAQPYSIKIFSDYRMYNHMAPAPSVQANYTQNWGPDNANFGFYLTYKFEGLNIKAFADPADHLTVKIYGSSSDRTYEVNAKHTQVFTIPFIADIPLQRHSRQSFYKPSTTGWQLLYISNFDYSWLSGSDTTGYSEIYMSDVSGNRKMNFGTRANNYTDITFNKATEYQAPRLNAQNNNIPSPPAGYSAIFPVISSGAGSVCGYGTGFDETEGSSAYAFNIAAKGIYGGGSRIVGVDSVDIILTLNGVRTVVATGVELYSGSGRYFSGALAESGVWNYGSVGIITFENGNISSNPAYTQC